MWFVNLLASAATNYATSDNLFRAGIVALLAASLFVVVWHRRKIREGEPGVEPWHLIVGGMSGVVIFAAIALSGIIWQVRGSPLGQPQKAADEQTPPPSTTVQKRYFAADIDARIKAIDRVDTIVSGFQPILMQSQEFWNHIRDMIRHGTASAQLTTYKVCK
jgi:hypothetical protein